MSSNQSITKGATLTILTMLVGSLLAAATKHVSQAVSIHTIIATQFLISLIILSPWIFRHGFEGINTNRPYMHLFRSLCGLLSFYPYYFAIKNVPLADAALLRQSAPLCVPIALWVWLKITVPANRWIAIIIGFIGVAFILKPGSSELNGWYIIGFSSAIFLSLSMISTRLLCETEPTKRIIFYYFIVSLIISLPLSAYYWQPVPLWAIPYLLFIGLSFYIMMILFTKAYLYAKPSIIGPLSYFGVIFAGIVGWVIWDQVPDKFFYIGFLLVASGGIITLSLGTKSEDTSD